MEGRSGRLAFASPPDAVAAMFPAASRWLGPRRVAALAATTLLVGMVCPGLHSIYGDLTVEACDEKVPEDRLGFRVRRLIRVSGRCAWPSRAAAWWAPSRASLACRPTPQASAQELADVVEPGEFAGPRLWWLAARADWAR